MHLAQFFFSVVQLQTIKRSLKLLAIEASPKLSVRHVDLVLKMSLHSKAIGLDIYTLYLVDVAIHIIEFLCRPKPIGDHPRCIYLISKALLRIHIRVSAPNRWKEEKQEKLTTIHRTLVSLYNNTMTSV